MRKLVAIGLCLAWLAIYIVLVATLSGPVSALPRWLQPLFYIIAGLAWIVPIRPLFRWMNRIPDLPRRDGD